MSSCTAFVPPSREREVSRVSRSEGATIEPRTSRPLAGRPAAGPRKGWTMPGRNAQSTPRYRVYVVRLSNRLAAGRRFRQRNSGYVPGKPVVDDSRKVPALPATRPFAWILPYHSPASDPTARSPARYPRRRDDRERAPRPSKLGRNQRFAAERSRRERISRRACSPVASASVRRYVPWPGARPRDRRRRPTRSGCTPVSGMWTGGSTSV